MEAFSIVNIRTFVAAQGVIEKTLLDRFSYHIGLLPVCFGALLGMGAFWRACTLVAILFANKKQRR